MKKPARKIAHQKKRMTVGEWLEIWQRDYLISVKPSTAFLYKEQIRLYIKPRLGTVQMDKLTPRIVQTFCTGLAEIISPKSVKNVHGVLHRALEQAVNAKVIDYNPAHGTILPRRKRPEIQTFSEAQISAFMELLHDHRHEILYKVALFTGLREGELLGLTWDCVDFRQGTILVKQQLQKERQKGGGYYLGSPKNGKQRILTPAPFVMGLLKQQKIKQAEMRATAGTAWQDTDFVFTNQVGGCLSYRTAYDCFKRIMEQMGLPNMRVHDLRHTYAVMALRAGDDIKTLSQHMGHYSVSFTLDVYGHVTEDMEAKSSAKMQTYIRDQFNF